ncbi:hypothetical protein Pan44_53270 [Caulifigura coniformis]|uniref:HTH cro/C1-type domain-containing protein n=1 Tax=Caulifigura coniformis TaxID=2527983 RepID=A0A517SMA8_9PLAN|nr:helix-turn-helix domain-containing protein [Caulifigura coniformis]QDT57259.1 hypothetical protein Pan44_53270 [Caulifigura coniformis]
MPGKNRDLATEARERTGLSDQQLAGLLGVQRVTIWFWRKGKTHPNADHATALRKIINRPAASRDRAILNTLVEQAGSIGKLQKLVARVGSRDSN